MAYRNYAFNGRFGEPPPPAARACNNQRIPERTEVRPFAIGRFACAQRRNDRFVVVNRAITRALEMLNNTITEVVNGRNAVCQGSAPGTTMRPITLEFLNRLGVCVNDINVWTAGTFVNRSVAEVIRRLVRTRNLIASNSLRYICGGDFCGGDTWAFVFPFDNDGNCLPGTPPLEVHLCARFFNPGQDPVTRIRIPDNVHQEFQAQTIIHEASHLTHCTSDRRGHTIGVAECLSQFVAATNGSPLDPVFLSHCSTSRCPVVAVAPGVHGLGAVAPNRKRVATTIFHPEKAVWPDGRPVMKR